MNRSTNPCILTWTPPDRPAEYFPPTNGVYEVSAGLRKFGTDFGNGVQDRRVFQLDSEYQHFVDNKIACRNERLFKYYCVHQSASSDTYQTVCRYIMKQLAQEYSDQFHLCELGPLKKGMLRFVAKPLGLSFDISESLDILSVQGPAVTPPFVDLFDALSLCVQDDLAIMERSADGGHLLTRAHICAAGHWSPEEKIGRNFIDIHKPVPGSESMNRSSQALVEGVINKGPFVRFTWSIVTDRRLNHHPIPPTDIDKKSWDGRQFDLKNPEFFMRVERQTLIGFSAQGAFLFCIRPQYLAGTKIKANDAQRRSLVLALESMTTESRIYKGLGSSLSDLISHLNNKESP